MPQRNVILCIGSVSSKQYQTTRLKLLRKGVRPKIVRIPSEVFSLEEGGVFHKEASAAKLTPVESNKGFLSDHALEELIRRWIEEHVLPIGRLAVVLFGEELNPWSDDDRLETTMENIFSYSDLGWVAYF